MFSEKTQALVDMAKRLQDTVNLSIDAANKKGLKSDVLSYFKNLWVWFSQGALKHSAGFPYFAKTGTAKTR